MDLEEVKEKILSSVSEKIDIPAEELKMDALLMQDLGLDSLGVLDLMLELEENFKMTIPDEDAEKIKTIGDAIQYIKDNYKG